MKKALFISCLLLSLSGRAQKKNMLDTIYANDKKNVALFFPHPIRQGITGAENFVFSYNREKEQYFGLLQATPGEESNLLIITTDGSVFSYIVKYSEQLSKVNYFIPRAESIGNEKPIPSELSSINEYEEGKDTSKRATYGDFCSYLLKNKQRIGALKSRNQRIVLNIENIVFDKGELYFVMEIENRSTLDYDLNFLNFSVQTRKRGKKKSMQNLLQKPVFKYHFPERIKPNETKRFVLVLPKFSLGNNKIGVMELNEKDGERNVKLKIKPRFINNPN